jgi:hypothetical protein
MRTEQSEKCKTAALPSGERSSCQPARIVVRADSSHIETITDYDDEVSFSQVVADWVSLKTSPRKPSQRHTCELLTTLGTESSEERSRRRVTFP